MSSLKNLVENQNGLEKWNTGLHTQVDNKPESSTKALDVSIKSQVSRLDGGK